MPVVQERHYQDERAVHSHMCDSDTRISMLPMQGHRTAGFNDLYKAVGPLLLLSRPRSITL